MDKNGFTLVEILVVIAIIALLVAIAVPQLSIYRMRANNTLCTTDIRSLATAMEAYYVDNFTYATATLNNLTAGYSYIQTQIGGGNACNVQIPNQSGSAWTGTAVWAAGGVGAVTYTWISDGGGLQ